jgi:hypothetical protein
LYVQESGIYRNIKTQDSVPHCGQVKRIAGCCNNPTGAEVLSGGFEFAVERAIFVGKVKRIPQCRAMARASNTDESPPRAAGA